MPTEKTAYKELRKAKLRHFKNTATKTELKSLSKKFEKMAADKNSGDSKSVIKALISKIDKAASKGIIHKNAASRKISRLMQRLSKASKA